MSEYGLDDSPPQQHQLGGSETPLHNHSLDDPANAANNSIIGKVKSRVSSILPNRLSKWFSPSTKSQNDEVNGGVASANIARRRRRIEIEDEEDDENYDDDEIRHRGEYENHTLISKQEENSEAEDDEEDDDDASQNSEEEYNATLAAQKSRHDLSARQPPAKRSRLNVDMRDSPIIAPRRPLIASTPAVGSTYLRNSVGTASVSRSSYQRYTNLNLYGNHSKKEPAYNFSQHKDSASPKINIDIIDLISNPPKEEDDKLVSQSSVYSRPGISARKSLNIPTSSSTRQERIMATVGQFKRQSMSTPKTDLPSGLTSGAVPPRRTSTTILEVKDSAENSECGDHEENTRGGNVSTYNGQDIKEPTNSYKRIKRQKHVNGSGLNQPIDIPEANEEAILLDTASESGESGTAELTKSQMPQRKTGLYNTSVAGTGLGTTRNSSRTSSFGNGLNFYSHLEGRKSLFTGPGHGVSNPLNNSTLSLTSLNRRQFNASIYGSTSALSDSRLLNTFSPFYKGKTTYGGAAAYNKYTTGAGASAVRITPTLIRPTSSLSTLSSSNNSLANTNANSQQIGESSTISSTAKRILDLINDFATPLSEAKKMASNLKTNPNLQMPSQAMGRLNESDLNASRAMRLSQVRTPYSRPAVILQPSGNANGRGIMGGPMPPVKELQVPTMSQLLQMKKIQNTTENARNITRNNSKASSYSSEYTLPTVTSIEISKPPSGTNESEQLQPQIQQKHTNKIKNKVSNTLRTSTTSKDLQDEAPPPSVHLPNIAFPLMQSVPKFNIKFSTTSTVIATSTSSTFSTTKSIGSSPTTQTAFTAKMSTSTTQAYDGKLRPATSKPCTFGGASTTSSTNVNFKFSEPLVVKGVNTPTKNITPTNLNNYKFSPPLDVTLSMTPNTINPKPQQPHLKTGSCLDVLNKPLSLPPPISTAATDVSKSALLSANLFGNQFKKSSNEWECEACMIRNKSTVTKCVACETPQKQPGGTPTSNNLTSNASLPALSSNFGQQFKQSSTEWECDTCMIRNKEGIVKCVACETPRKRVVGTLGASTNSATLPPIKNSFGDAFKPKTGTWECSTCLISNANEVTECVACQTKKPGSSYNTSNVPLASSFKFGFSNVQTSPAATVSDAGFKTLAAQQKASKWECDACMTRNDAERTKCACCEQPKPGSTTTDNSASATTKFSFGATATAKFSFGFGPGSNAPKEDELRKDNATNMEEKKTTTAIAVTTSNTNIQFGFKPTVSVAQEKKKDETDSKNNPSSVSSSAASGAGFKFGVTDAIIKKPETTTSSPALATTAFSFGSKTSESTSKITPNKTTTPTVTSPSVKFSLPSTVTASSSTTTSANTDKPTGIAAPTFSFGSNTASSTTEGFSFAAAKKPAVASDEKKTMEGFAFKTPAAVSSSTATKIAAPTTGFAFGSPSSNKNPLATITQPTTSSTPQTTPVLASAATTAAVKPMFSFGSNATAATSVAPATTTSGRDFGGFSFGSSSTPATTATTGKTLFGSVTSTSFTTTTTASTNSSTTPAATTNLFGSFGGTTSATPTFGSSAAAIANPANNSTTVSSSTNSSNNSTANTTPTFGTFGSASQTTTNVFGSFGGSSQATNQNQNKPIAPVFGNVASSSGTQAGSPKTFLFGSATNTPAPVAPVASTSSTTTSVSSASTSWPKNSFVFGSASTTQSAQSANANKDAPKPSVFGAFGGGGGASNSSNHQSTSIFGNPATASTSNITSPPPAFGSTASTTNSSTNLFGVSSAPAPATNIFGANPSGNAVTPAPAFGSSPFGGSASSTSATPTFGSTAVTGSATFGGFGTVVGNTTNVSEIKKPEPAFNFGSAPASQQSTSGGFNFGSASAPTKPAFNFGGSGGAPQPTFNFTGSSESQSSAKPFQFGAIPSAPVFNFGGGAIEATPNAPFQFNAGTAAPVSSNIFAPAPTPGAQSAQQAKRKIRAPIRRVTQR